MVDYTVLYWRRSARGQVGEGLLFCLVFGGVEVVAIGLARIFRFCVGGDLG